MLYLNEFTREQTVRDRARRYEAEAVRYRLAREARAMRRGLTPRCRLTVEVCTALGLDDVGVGRSRMVRFLASPLMKLERECSACRARILEFETLPG